MELATVHADKIFFAIGQIGPAQAQFAIRVCVDQYIDSLQFTDSENPSVIRVNRFVLLSETVD